MSLTFGADMTTYSYFIWFALRQRNVYRQKTDMQTVCGTDVSTEKAVIYITMTVKGWKFYRYHFNYFKVLFSSLLTDIQNSFAFFEGSQVFPAIFLITVILGITWLWSIGGIILIKKSLSNRFPSSITNVTWIGSGLRSCIAVTNRQNFEDWYLSKW